MSRPAPSLWFAGLIALTACHDPVASPTTDPSLRGGPPRSDVSVTLADFVGDMTVPTAPIVDGVDFADAKLRAESQLWVDTYDGNSKRGDPVTHRVCFDLSDAVAVHSPSDLVEFSAAIGGDLGAACTWGLLHTRTHSNGDGGMLSQNVGLVEHAGGKFVFKELDTKNGSWDWRVIFDTPVTAAGPDRGAGLCITRQDANTWSLSNGCTATDGTVVDGELGLWRFPGPIHVADFTASVNFTVQR